MTALYIGLGVLVFLFIFITLFGYVMARYYSRPHRWQYEDTKADNIKHNDHFNYDELKREEYTITLRDNYVLNARHFILHPESKKYIIMAHGYTVNQVACAKYIPIFDRLGYNVVTYDERGHGINKIATCTMSYRESEDLLEVIDDTYKRYGDDIYLGLHGESMGAATVLSSMRYNPKVKFIIADCPYADLLELSIGSAKKMFHAPAFLVKYAGLVCRVFFGWNSNKVKPVEGINNSKAPLLLCHGDSDNMIDCHHSKEVYDAYQSYKELYIAKGADHAMSVVVDYPLYEKMVDDFLSKAESLNNE